MNADAQRPDAYNKPLPLPHDDQPAYNGDDSHRPSQPAHTPGDYHTGMALNGRPGLQPIDTSALMPGDGYNGAPLTPISPGNFDPSSPSSEKSKKKANPLTDLIETEKVYVDLLTGIIRKVAAAWSRSNLPPPELDSMFRSVESVYKANRSLLAKLKEIGANPSSPKALGDLLMRWIDDLEPPYTKYTANYVAGFDEWGPVQGNARLPNTLATFSASNPPKADASGNAPAQWTLDALFLLPKERLLYYRKLYSRLLKSTAPGRSDHRLLTGALEKLDGLLSTLDERASLHVGAEPQVQTEDEVVMDLRARQSTLPPAPASHRGSDSTNGSSSASSGAFSQDTSVTSVSSFSSSSAPITILDLERRLSTDRTLDIFTMQPKQVRLQIAPPNLHYARELRLSVDVTLQLVPRSTGLEVVQERGHVFILTDLLLMCEWMAPADAAAYGPNGADLWLLYPPLAGKHLKVAPVEGSDTALNVTILRKETVTMYASSRQLRDKIVAEFNECIDAAAMLMPGRNAQPPPPVPKLPGLPSAPVVHREPSITSPHSNMSSPTNGLPPMQQLNESMGNMGFSNSQSSSNTPSRAPSLNNGGPQPMFPQRSTSINSQHSYAPGQVMPGQTMGPERVTSPTSYAPRQPQPLNLAPGQLFNPSMHPPPRSASFLSEASSPASPFAPRASSYSDTGPSPQRPGMGMGAGRMAHSPAPSSRPPSDGSSGPALRKSSSSRSLASQYDRPFNGPLPPVPAYPDGLAPPSRPFLHRNDSSSSLSSLPSSIYGGGPPMKPLMPSAAYSMKAAQSAPSFMDPSPPSSPVEETPPPPAGPTTTSITAEAKCKVFLQEQHAKWKSLGAAKLKLYHESPTNVKQLVVEADSKKAARLISTIVLPDGVERVGKTGVAIELSDKGQRTGIVYLLQCRDEKAAGKFFEQLLAGSDRSEASSR
ncbi:hypothetical protein EIP86_011268 [Pleurotus ostreatoroseus]|nr:hypothetical protein EIP86_011268 [Pleurotus ostreatoroseus]